MDLRPLESLMWRAPSAHNTQPWTLIYGDDSIEVCWDPAYALPAADPTGRDLRLSMGAFVETALIAARDLSFEAELAGHRVGWLVAGRYETDFTSADLRDRRTNRGPYEAGRLRESIVADLNELATVHVLDTRQVAGLMVDADRHMFSSVPITDELRQWLRLTPTHPSYDRDGLTDRALALSRTEAVGLRTALALHRPLHRVGLPAALAAASRSLLAYDGSVLVLEGPSDPAGQVEAGRALMRLWLTLTRYGLACHPLSQIIDCLATRTTLAATLGTDPARLLHVARVGRPLVHATVSPRRK
ncbi:nitroreductase [Fodinicola acaciae]|uniref:nitroreductase n=1 Tax=Fodinicola acaciae TaxID=2681555 RepID=UPI0013D237F3|nr:nitroreductase [Fodinicola acaciae]